MHNISAKSRSSGPGLPLGTAGRRFLRIQCHFACCPCERSCSLRQPLSCNDQDFGPCDLHLFFFFLDQVVQMRQPSARTYSTYVRYINHRIHLCDLERPFLVRRGARAHKNRITNLGTRTTQVRWRDVQGPQWVIRSASQFDRSPDFGFQKAQSVKGGAHTEFAPAERRQHHHEIMTDPSTQLHSSAE